MANHATMQDTKQSKGKKDSAPKAATNAGSAAAANAQKTQNVVSFSKEEIKKILKWYANQGYDAGFVVQMQTAVGAKASGKVDEATILAVASWQKANGLGVDGLFGPASAAAAGIKMTARPASVAKGEAHDRRADEVQQGLSAAKFKFTAGGIAGIMGNMEAESQMDVAMTENVKGGVDGGLCSWHGSRAKKLRDNAPKGDWKNVGYQLDFMYSELGPELKGILTNKEYADNPKYCAGAFCAIFERPMNYNAEKFATLPEYISLSDRSGSVKKSRFVLNVYDGRYYLDLQRRIDAALFYYGRYQSGAPVTLKTAEPSKPDSNVKAKPAAKEKKENTRMDVTIDVYKAVKYNKKYGYSKSKWKKIQKAVGLSGSDVDGYVGPITTQKIANWQRDNGFKGDDVDGICGPKTLARMFPDGADTKETKPKSNPKSSDPHEAGGKVETTPVDNSEIPTQTSVRNNTSIYGHVDKAGSKLKAVTTPYKMYYGSSSATIKVHEKVADRVTNIFAQTAAAYTQEEIEDLGLNQYSGCYNKRKVRGGNSWSIHSWGIAIDIDAGRNPMKSNGKEPLASSKAKKFWEIVESNGGVSLGRECGYDWMHFQFAKLK